jgi:hypothetical protein
MSREGSTFSSSVSILSCERVFAHKARDIRPARQFSSAFEAPRGRSNFYPPDNGLSYTGPPPPILRQSRQRSPSLPVATSCSTTLYPRSQQSLQHPEPVPNGPPEYTQVSIRRRPFVRFPSSSSSPARVRQRCIKRVNCSGSVNGPSRFSISASASLRFPAAIYEAIATSRFSGVSPSTTPGDPPPAISRTAARGSSR